jgi:diadenosine tetraphosphatase ApaH/serine/threonine PP2A family protein phosphatase
LESLSIVMSRIDPADGLLCLGDIVGYGPNPNECVALIRERATVTILGNHDLAAIDNFGVQYFNPAAREALHWTQSVLTSENAEWLDGLAYEFRMPDFLMVHGAPVNYFEYILDKEGAARAFAATDAPLILIGHTHIAEAYLLRPDASIEVHSYQQGGTLRLEEGTRYIINVGSVGQPRDLNPQASFAFYDPGERTVTIERYDYPIAQVQEKIEEAHLPEALAKRLVYGR